LMLEKHSQNWGITDLIQFILGVRLVVTSQTTFIQNNT